jgi:hypothetical protein
MSSMPSVSNALINFISESTLPRTTPSLASKKRAGRPDLAGRYHRKNVEFDALNMYYCD